ncbi:MAG: hypothetical protein CML68_13735 [Rhodobacteraceae bacterium]|nr:hypothetical protein [Paracoccaceae bacterium]
MSEDLPERAWLRQTTVWNGLSGGSWQSNANGGGTERDAAIKERDAARKTLAELRPLRCSFCGKTQHEVRKLVAGPDCFICDECVDLCVKIVAPDKEAGG